MSEATALPTEPQPLPNYSKSYLTDPENVFSNILLDRIFVCQNERKEQQKPTTKTIDKTSLKITVGVSRNVTSLPVAKK